MSDENPIIKMTKTAWSREGISAKVTYTMSDRIDEYHRSLEIEYGVNTDLGKFLADADQIEVWLRKVG